jgi:hypothetical protein
VRKALYAIALAAKSGVDAVSAHSMFATRPALTFSQVASFSVAIPDADVVVQGAPAVYVQPTSTSGTRCERHFCGTCGSHILGTSGLRPGFRFIKAALFDTPPEVLTDVFMEDAYGMSRAVVAEARLVDYSS